MPPKKRDRTKLDDETPKTSSTLHQYSEETLTSFLTTVQSGSTGKGAEGGRGTRRQQPPSAMSPSPAGGDNHDDDDECWEAVVQLPSSMENELNFDPDNVEEEGQASPRCPDVSSDLQTQQGGVKSKAVALAEAITRRSETQLQRGAIRHKIIFESLLLQHLMGITDIFRWEIEVLASIFPNGVSKRIPDSLPSQPSLRPLWITADVVLSPKPVKDNSPTVTSVFSRIFLEDISKLSALSVLDGTVLFTAIARYVGLQCRIAKAFDDKMNGEVIPDNKDNILLWCEVWCPQREMYVSVLPCLGQKAPWGHPYCLSAGMDHFADVTARYVPKWGSVLKTRRDSVRVPKFPIWLYEKVKGVKITGVDDEMSSDDDDDGLLGGDTQISWSTQCLTEMSQNQMYTGRLEEEKQLKKLQYASEPLPKTMEELKMHPLYVAEKYLRKREGIYPINTTTLAGYVKDIPVYYRWAVRCLRTRYQWLRRGCFVPKKDEKAYKLIPPPPSRGLFEYRKLYGSWQVEPYMPTPWTPGNPLPRNEFGNYELFLNALPPAGLVHKHGPKASDIATRHQIDHVVVIVGFKKAFDSIWIPEIDGLLVRAGNDSDRFDAAYETYVEEMKALEQKVRWDRALAMWSFFIRRVVTYDRLMKGCS